MMRARAAVLVAAGASSRMGQPKALLEWRGTTLLGSCVAELRRASVHDLVVVLGPSSDAVRNALPATDPPRVAYNLDVASGRSSSIRIGASAIADSPAPEAVLVQSVDQPCPTEVLEQLFDAIERGAGGIAIPTFEGRRGHPVCFAGHLLPQLRELSEASEGLRAVVRAHAAAVVEVPVATEAVRWNLNDPEAYAAALAASTEP
jgi:molybdenum cofactor cytidylyltransferase